MRARSSRPGPPIPRTRWGLPADVAPGLERQAIEGLPPIAGFLGLLWAFFTIVHLFVIPAPIGLVLAAATGTAAALTLTIAVAARRRPPPPRQVHPILLVLGFTALALTMLHFGLTGELWQTTNLMLILVGGGALLISPVAYAILVTTGIAVWLVLASMVDWGEVAAHFSFAVSLAAGLGIFVHGLRLRSLVAAERMRLRSADHMCALEQTSEALANSERRAEATTPSYPTCCCGSIPPASSRTPTCRRPSRHRLCAAICSGALWKSFCRARSPAHCARLRHGRGTKRGRSRWSLNCGRQACVAATRHA